MNKRRAQAKENFSNGFNCAQSVFLSFQEVHNIDPETAARLVTCLGGGISKTKNIFGALSGACLAMSSKCGKKDPSEPERQAQTYENAQNMIHTFEEEFGSTCCPVLLGYDISIPEELDKAVEADAFQKTCQAYVQRAAELASEYVDDKK